MTMSEEIEFYENFSYILVDLEVNIFVTGFNNEKYFGGGFCVK